MSNPFDQFDSTESGAANPFDQFDAAKPAKKQGIMAELGSSLKRGIGSTIDYGKVSLTDNPDEIAGIVSDNLRNQAPQSAARQKMNTDIQPYAQEAADAQGIMANIGAYGKLAGKRALQLAENPREFAGMVAENLPNSAPGIAGMIAGGVAGAATPIPFGTAIGGVVGGTAGGYKIEQGSSMFDQITKEAQARGIDTNDKAALSGMISEKYPEFLKASQLKGIGTAGTDAALNVATLGVAGMGERTLVKEARTVADLAKAGTITGEEAASTLAGIEAKNAGRNTIGQKVLRGTGVTAGEMAGESASEAVGQQLAYGKLDPLDVIDEGLLAFGQGVGMAAGRKFISPLVGATDKDTITQEIERARSFAADLNASVGGDPNAVPTLVTDFGPIQRRIDELHGVDATQMDDKARAQYEKDFEAAYGEVVGYTTDANGLEIPFTVGDYLNSQVRSADMTRDKPLAAGANDQSANRLSQLADEESTQQPDIAPAARGIAAAPVIPVVGPLSAVANAAVQSGAHQATVMQQAAAIATGKTESATGKSGTPAGAQKVATAPAQGPLTEVASAVAPNIEGNPNAASPAPVAKEAPKENAPQVGAAPAKAEGASGSTGQAFISSRTDVQLSWLAEKGKGENKDLAKAELQRRRGESASPQAMPSGVGYEQRSASRVLRINKAKTQKEFDAITAEEHSDGERHFEGTERVRSAIDDRKFALKIEAAKSDEASRYEAGEWVSVSEHGSRSAAEQESEDLQRKDPSSEYGLSIGQNDGWSVRKRKKPEAAPVKSEQPQPAKGAENAQAQAEVLNKAGAVSVDTDRIDIAAVFRDWVAKNDRRVSAYPSDEQMSAYQREASNVLAGKGQLTSKDDFERFMRLRAYGKKFGFDLSATYTAFDNGQDIGPDGGLKIKSTSNQNPIKNESPAAATDSAETGGQDQEPIKKDDAAVDAVSQPKLDVTSEPALLQGSAINKPSEQAASTSRSDAAPEDKQDRAPASKPKARNKIEPEKDSLFVAIAKAGGMDTDELLSNGIDSNDITFETAAQVKKNGQLSKKRRMPISFGFALPLHKKGGMSFDAMREAMQQYGYMPQDATKNDAIDLFRQELAGEPVFTPQAIEQQQSQDQEEFDKMMQEEQDRIDAELAAQEIVEDETGFNDLSFDEQSLANDFAEFAFGENGKQDDNATRAGMRALGFTEEEINDELAKNSQSQRESEEIAGRPGQEGGADRNGNRAQDAQARERGGEEGFDLAGQTNTQAADQFAQQQAGENDAPTKAQADRERDAVPFSLGQQSQPKPQGMQTGLFTADGRAAKDAVVQQAAPEWHTKLPTKGLPITDDQRKPSGYGRVPGALADEAYSAITQNQLMNGVPMYAYYMPAANGLNGIVRLLPDDQNAAKPWVLLNGEAIRPAGQTKEQVVAKLTVWLRSAPVLGDDSIKEAAKPAEQTSNSALPGNRRDPTKVNVFNPYEDGDVVTIDGKDWQVRNDGGWYLTTTGNWRGEHPEIKKIPAMVDLIRAIEQASVAKPEEQKSITTKSLEDDLVRAINDRIDSMRNGEPASKTMREVESTDYAIGQALQEHEALKGRRENPEYYKAFVEAKNGLDYGNIRERVIGSREIPTFVEDANQAADAELERRILIAADSIDKLRKVDVERVLMQGNIDQQKMAEYIKRKRPELAGEVDDVMADIAPAKPVESAPSEMDALKAEMGQAIGELASILGAKQNLTPEEESRIIPVMSKIFRIAAKMGYIKFKDAAKYVLDQIRQLAGADVADKISIDNLQAGYINIAKEIGGDKREAMSYDSIEDLEKANVTDQRSGTNLEPDSGNAGTADAMGEEGIRAGRDGNGGTGRSGIQGSEEPVRAGSSGKLSGPEAVASGERGNREIYTGATELSPGSAGNSVDSGSRDSGLEGAPVEPDAAKATRESATSPNDLKAKAAEQAKADKTVAHKEGIEAIRAALPVLTENQQDDVAKAETRFAEPDGYGMLFTNGTGTGKTFTGLGVIKRFANQGKTNILIVAPNDKIIEDWQKSGTLLGLDLSRLADTNDAGKGIVITTYANMGQNNALAKRDWDLVVHDEAHYLAMDKDGTNTNALKNLRAITLHPDGVFQRAEMLHGDIRAAASIAQKEADLAANSDDQRNWPMAQVHQNRANKLNAEFKAKQEAIKEDVAGRQGANRTRALFLSATPFAYEKTVDWANGYIFDYNEGRGDESREFRGYNTGSNSDQFMMQHFGYRMRYGKLTQPDAKVDSGLMQRQFNTWLKKKGSLSGRMLDVSADYDRKFILVDSAIGRRIDDALQWFGVKRKELDKEINPDGNRFASMMSEPDPRSVALYSIQDSIAANFDYLSRRYLLESIKAKEVVPHVREHLALGRKVVVFHDYLKGGGFNPFIIDFQRGDPENEKSAQMQAAYNQVVREFNAEFSDIIDSDLFRQSSPIDMFKQEFPDVLMFNGNVSQKQRRANVAKFQDDASGPQVILVQSQAGKEGISLHDTTGKHQRVLFNLGQPTQPTTAIQQEGRIYRTGQVTDAIFRYLNTGSGWEEWAFATTIAQRASAAENLGMGEQARSLKDAFISGFEESGDYRAGMENEGKGGKERDKAANDALTEYDRARAFYFGTQKKTSKTKAQEGADYFATPEPIGLKMVEWADIRPGEKVLEPSAGHGAIARWIPDTAEKTAIEPSMALRPRLAMVFDGQIIDSDFESLNVVNKFDAIVMNPPFGTAGKTAVDHLAKAATHLRDGGRIVALLPTGPAADKKFDKWFYEESSKPAKPLGTISIDGKEVSIYKGDSVESRASWAPAGVVTGWRNGAPMVKATAPEFGGAVSMVSGASIKSITPGDRTESVRPAKDLYMIGDIKLPGVTFERAGTGVMTRIVVIEKVTDKDAASRLTERQRDYSDIGDINGLFDKIEDVSLPSRSKPIESEPEPAATQNRTRAEKPAPAKVGDVATVNGNEYAIEIYTTNDGKDKRGIWMEEKEAKEINPRAFKSSKMRGTPAEGKFFVDEYWLNKRKPDAAGNIAAPSTMSPADKAIYGMAAEGKSAADILKFIAASSRSPFNRQVAKLLLKTGISPSVTVGDGKTWNIRDAKSGEAFAAAYDPKTNTVALFRPASAERNALHELIHAASLKALAKNGLASAQMKALFAHVEKTGKLNGMYGIRNVDEFIAEAFSNPKFQAMLKQVSAAPVSGKPSSAWDWFIRVVRGILGLKQGQENALSQALDIGIGVMRENMRLNEAGGETRYNAAPGKKSWSANDYQKRADQLDRAFTAMGLESIRESSRASASEYVAVQDPNDEETTYKFRVSNHRLPSGYAQPDFDVIADGVEHDGAMWNASGTWIDAVNWISDKTGKEPTGIVKAMARKRRHEVEEARRTEVVEREKIKAQYSDQNSRIIAEKIKLSDWLDSLPQESALSVSNKGRLNATKPSGDVLQYGAKPFGMANSTRTIADARKYVESAPTPNSAATRLPGAPDKAGMQERSKTEPAQSKSVAGSEANVTDGIEDGNGIRYNVADEGWSVTEQAKETVMRLAGRPMLDPSDPFAAENARLREQDQSLWSKAKKQMRRYLAPGGLLPQSVFAEKIKRDSEFQAVEFDVRHLIGGLEHAVKADFGMAFDKLSKEQMRPITEALAGNVPASLPEATKTAAVAMRQYIDGMSTEYLKIIQQKIDAKMLKALESGKDADKAQAINEIELFEKIKGNIGRYVHRSYQAFDDPKWFEKVPALVLNASRLYLKQGYMEAGETDAKAAQLAEVTLHEILKNGTAYDSMESFIAESKLGAKDLSVLMRRKEVPAQIRALLGEYPDARLNFTKSATKMGRLIWNTRFLDRVRDIGMGSFFFEGKDRPANATTQIAADGSEVYAPLNGLWTFPEIAQSFKDALGKEQMSDLYRAIVRANGLVKYGKTILAPTTAMRNWQSAMFFSLANGHFDLTQMKKSISAFREQVSQKATGQDLKYLRHLKQLGVVYDTPYAGEMARLMEDARMEELLSRDKGDAVRWFRKANQLAQGFYTFGDDFWKIIGFENEKAGLMKAGLSLQEAEIEAAKRIRDTYPTYSMVGRGVQWLSRFPLAGTFVSFPAEIIRTSGNMLRTVAADLKSDNPKLRELGMKRAAGMVFVSAAFYGLAALSMAMAGVGDDEDEAIRDLAPEWQKNSTFLYLGRDEKGNLRYFDMSFLDPYGYWKRPITAMLRNQPWEDSLASGLRGMLEPFLGADISSKAIFEAVSNAKESGGKVYKENDGAIDQAVDIADHLRKALQPGVVGNVERLVKAAGDVRKSSGQPYSMEDELVALVGWRATTIDPKTALYYRSFEFTDAVAEARKTLTDTLRDANDVSPEDIKDARERAKSKQEQAFKEMSRLVGAAEAAGMSKMQIVQTLRLSNISQANIGSLMRGATPDVSITPQLAARAVRQASQMRGPEFAADVFDRYRQAMAK